MLKQSLMVLCALLTGCAMTPQELAQTPTGSLCVRYASAPLNPHRESWLREVYSRGESCAPYAAEMALAASQAQSSLNSLNQRYAPSVPPVPGPTPILSVSPTVTAFLKNSYVQGMSRICVYDALGSPHIITIEAFQMCPLTVQK